MRHYTDWFYMKNNKPKLDNYAIAHQYKDTNQLCVYTFLNQVHYMSFAEAKKFRDSVRKKTGDNYKIYKLVEVKDV